MKAFLKACGAAAALGVSALCLAYTDAEQHAIDRARQALQTRNEWIEGLAVESVTATQWSDSSLGCRRPGANYMQVITSGYAVKFVGKDARRDVHIAGENVVVCGSTLRGGAKRPRTAVPRVPLRTLDAMIEAARADLATRIAAKPESVKLVSWSPVRLPASVLHCEGTATNPSEEPVPGYNIVLSYEGRPYPYHSDLHSVVACPRIEKN